MSLNREELNTLSVLGVRSLNFIPEHFLKMTVSTFFDQRLVDNWINFNLNGRYAIIKNIGLDSSKKIVEVFEIGFEDPKELTMFMLGCPYLNKIERK